MGDKVAEMEERLNRLEEKLKVTFVEIEKRMTQQAPQQTVDFGDRIDELEDLLLLLQLESTKMREKVGEGLDFGITPTVPDISERLNRMESELAGHNIPADFTTDAKIESLEEKINAPVVIDENHPIHQDVRELEKRIKTLEALLAERGRKEIEAHESDSTLLNDIKGILGR